MKNLQLLDDFSCIELSEFESIDVIGGGPWWYELLKTMAHSAAYDIAKEAYQAVDKSMGSTSPSGSYHDAMRSSNHGGIR